MVINITAFMYVDPHYCGTPEYGQHSLPYKLAYYYIAMTAQRFLYYVVFAITDSSCIAAGLGYHGKDDKGNHKWDKIVGVYILEVELGTSPVEMFRFWNHQIHLWLKNYIYFRLVAPGEKPNVL